MSDFATVAERLYWAYADRAKAHAAVTAGATYTGRNALPPLLLLRRYLKLALLWFEREGLMGSRLDDRAVVESPFRLECLPGQLPSPSGLSLWTTRADPTVHQWLDGNRAD